jgi:hypothetical protein
MEQESKDNNKNKLDGFFIVDDGTLPISKEGSLFIGWMEMRLKECIDVEDYEEVEKLKRDIQKMRDNMVMINPSNDSEVG